MMPSERMFEAAFTAMMEGDHASAQRLIAVGRWLQVAERGIPAFLAGVLVVHAASRGVFL